MKLEKIKTNCDFCGEVKSVVRTTYGTTHYIRLICKNCIDKINKYHQAIDGWEKALNDDGTFVE